MPKEYSFTAERQLIFYVNVDSLTIPVQFSDRSIFGSSVFNTLNEKVAKAIRKTSMFMRGVIQETTKEDEAVESTTVKKPSKKEVVKQEIPNEKSFGNEDNVITVDNFTQAREAVAKRLQIAKSEIKNPMALQAVCKKHGLVIQYCEQ